MAVPFDRYRDRGLGPQGAVSPSGLCLGVYQDANYNVSIHYQPIASNPYVPGSLSFKQLTLVSNTDTLGGTLMSAASSAS